MLMSVTDMMFSLQALKDLKDACRIDTLRNDPALSGRIPLASHNWAKSAAVSKGPWARHLIGIPYINDIEGGGNSNGYSRYFAI